MPVRIDTETDNDVAAEDIAAQKEAARLERRRIIRQRLAEKAVLQLRADELAQEIRQTEQRLEQLAAEHERGMQPVQQKLAEANKRITSALAQRHQPNDKDVAERRRLLDQITEANRALEADLQVEKSLLAGLRRQYQAAASLATQHHAHENELARPGIANPQLEALAFCAKAAMAWSDARLKDAKAKRNHVAESLRTAADRYAADEIPALTARLALWTAEVEAAESALAAARRASDKAHEDVINE